MAVVLAAATLVLSGGGVAPLTAQRIDAARAGIPDRVGTPAGWTSMPPPQASDARARDTLSSAGPVWWMPLASAALPGIGQALQGQDRYVAYVALETFAWIRFAAEAREGRRQRQAYRGLANRVARAFYTDRFPTGTFDYYERMQHFVESGAYDLTPDDPVLQPERDTTTYNGAVWLLARRTFWVHPDSAPPPESPAYRTAERFYVDRAVTPDFQWSWRDAQLEHDLYRRTISLSNEAYRRSVQALGVVLANHVLSMVDSYVTLRLWQEEQSTGQALGFTATVAWGRLDRPAQ